MKKFLVQTGLMILIQAVMLHSASAKGDDIPVTRIKVEIGKVSEVVFPERVVKVIKGGAPDSVLVEVMDTAVYLLPKTEHPADLFVTTSSQKSYPLMLEPSAERDIKVSVEGSSRQGVQNYAYADVMELMKDLLLGLEPRMASPAGKSGELLMENEYIKLVIERGYQLHPWRVYVLKVSNLTQNALVVPVERISLPDLLAVSVDKDMLAAKGENGDETLMYVIMGSS